MLKETIVNEEFIQEMQQYRQKPVGKGLIEACSDSVILFAEHMLGIKLRAWQIYVLYNMQLILEGKTQYREAVILTSRQIGKTSLDAIFGDWVTIFNKKPSGLENNSPIGIISASDDQAKKLLESMRKMLILGDKFMSRTYKNPDDSPMFGKSFLQDCIDKKGANNTDTITLCKYDEKLHGKYLLKDSSIGTAIKSLPPTSAILGNTFAVAIVDEAGKNDKIPDMVFIDYLSPATDEFSAPTLYTSTAWNPSGIFYEKCDIDDNHPNDSVWRCCFTIEAIKIEAPKRYAETLKKIDALNAEGKVDEVQRAYYCRFVKGETVYFDPEKVKESFTNEYQMFFSSNMKCDIGVDFGGKVTSRTVITITGLNDRGKIQRLYHKRYPINGDMSLMEDLKDLMQRFPNWQRLIPDDCPAGQYFINLMILEGWNVQPMNFRADKVKKYGGFRAKLNKGLVESYLDTDLRTEMLAFEQSEKTKQSYIQHAPGYTDDMIDSFVMSSYYFVEEEKKPEFYYWGTSEENDD
jgi:hypothetical protein